MTEANRYSISSNNQNSYKHAITLADTSKTVSTEFCHIFVCFTQSLEKLKYTEDYLIIKRFDGLLGVPLDKEKK